MLRRRKLLQKQLTLQRSRSALIIKEAEIKASADYSKCREISQMKCEMQLLHLREEKDLIISKLKVIVSTQTKSS